MSNAFGGGFGGDFDDLLPRSSPVPPNLGNPFEDPFADIGRAHESDPWASYGETKPRSPTQSAFYPATETETETPDQSSRDLESEPPSSSAHDPPVTATYSAPQQDHIDPFSSVDTRLDYRPVTPTLPEPVSTSQETSTPTAEPSPAPTARTPTAPISPSKAGLFDDEPGSTFGSGFVRRHKSQRSSLSQAPGAAASEPRSGSLFSSTKADPLEALVSKARSASVARTPSTPKLEDSNESKDQPLANVSDPLEVESPSDLLTTEASSREPVDKPGPTSPEDKPAPVAPKEEPAPTSTTSPSPDETKDDGASTPKDSPVVSESPQTPQTNPNPPESTAPPTAPQVTEETSTTPVPPSPPSRAASESLAASQYPEGSTFTHSPGPGAYTRVVSPLDTPAAGSRNLTQSFSGLALGGEVPNPGWGGSQIPAPAPDSSLSPTARTAGWGAVDSTEGWGGEATHSQGQTGWGAETDFSPHPEPEHGFRGDEAASVSGQTHSRKQSESNESEGSRKEASAAEIDRIGTPQQSVRANESNGPHTFVITVGDPQKVGDSINPYIVYTVSTKTNSPHYRKPQFSVLRRYSDFLWLFETLSLNKPGVFIPPVPEKQGFGRFQGAFVEARRLALNNCIQKIANHPILATDEDFKFFIESDSFALDVKHRKAEIAQEKTGGFLSSITGPKFYETDEWFDAKRSYIDALESQLRGLAKSVETVSKSRAEVAAATGEFAETLVVLSTSDLSKQLSQSLAALADVHKKARKLEEDQSQDDLILLMGIVEEYIRLIGSVRLTFASRIRLHAAWQNANAEAKRVRTAHDKARRQGRIPQDRVGMSMHEVADAEKRAADAKFEFDQCSRLIKAEMARFEKERIDDFKKNLEALLEGMIQRQQDIIESLENYQEGLLRRSKSVLGQPPAPAQGQPNPEETPEPPAASS